MRASRLDAPPGFADTGFTGSPRLLELAEGLTSASNRILLFAISDADLRRFTIGDPLELRRYMLAATPKGMERDSVTSARSTPSSATRCASSASRPAAPTSPAPRRAAARPGQPSRRAAARHDRRLGAPGLPPPRRAAQRPAAVRALHRHPHAAPRQGAQPFGLYPLRRPGRPRLDPLTTPAGSRSCSA